MNTSTEIMNPYGNSNPVVRPNDRGQIDVEISKAVAEVQASVLLAKKFPRNPIESMDKILAECQRPGLAEVATYQYARGGTDITGPSIRLAEAIARNWQNLKFGVREVSQTNGESEMLAYCWDLETNVTQEKLFRVKHERHTKKGKYNLEDPRDIYEATANQAARRLRAAILGIIPGDVVDAAVAQCDATLKAKADTSPESVKKMLERFAEFGVTKEQIEKRIQRRLDSIQPAQIISLRKIYNSLKDSMSTPADWFETEVQQQPADQPKSGTEAAKAALKGKTKKDPAPEPSATPEVSSFGTCPKSPGDHMYESHCKVQECFEGCEAWKP